MKSFFAAQGAEPLVTSPKQFSEMPERNLANWAKASIPYILCLCQSRLPFFPAEQVRQWRMYYPWPLATCT
jgi:hypothetical protein